MKASDFPGIDQILFWVYNRSPIIDILNCCNHKHWFRKYCLIVPTFRYKQNRLQQLRGFCAVVETRSVSKAASRIHLTQPTVSLQVQSLERDLGATLFERRGPRIELTFEGALLYDPVSYTHLRAHE